MGMGPQPLDHGLGRKLARVLLSSECEWVGMVEWRGHYFASLPPAYMMRRWNVAKTKPGYDVKTFESYRNWIFANTAQKLEHNGEIERDYPDDDRGSASALWKARLTKKGLAAKIRDLAKAEKAPLGDLIRLLLPGQPKFDPAFVLRQLADLESRVAALEEQQQQQ